MELEMELFEKVSKIILWMLTAVFVYSTIYLSLLSFISGTCLIGYFILYIYIKRVNETPTKGDLSKHHEPSKYDEFITTYDATEAQSVQNFEVIQRNSACLFAKKAHIWGSSEWRDILTIEQNISRLLSIFLKFTVKCERQEIDGFVIQLPAEISSNLEVFSESVRRVLTKLSDLDPGGGHSMSKSYIDKPGWVFEFNKITMFITTFAPFYLDSNSRYGYGSPYGFILIQPELSFLRHNLPPSSVITNWANPKTIRDRIRIAFKNKGQEYSIPAILNYPMAEDIVKPLKEGDPVVKWWKNKET